MDCHDRSNHLLLPAELAGAVAELIEATNAIDLAFERQERAIVALSEAVRSYHRPAPSDGGQPMKGPHGEPWGPVARPL